MFPNIHLQNSLNVSLYFWLVKISCFVHVLTLEVSGQCLTGQLSLVTQRDSQMDKHRIG